MRAAITILAVIVVILLGVVLGQQGGRDRGQDQPVAIQPEPDAPVAEAQTPPPHADPDAEPAPQVIPPADDAPVAREDQPSEDEAAFAPIPGLRVRAVQPAETAPLGSVDPDGDFAMQVSFTRFGAAIHSVHLSRFFEDVQRTTPLAIQSPITIYRGADPVARAFPFAAHSIEINGQSVYVETEPWAVLGDGHFALTIEDEAGNAILRIQRRYKLSDLGPEFGHDLECNQWFENLSGRPLRIRWQQLGQGELPEDLGYLGDRRGFITGYYNLRLAGQRHVYTRDTIVARSDAISRVDEGVGQWTVWPEERIDDPVEMVWSATVNRYFAVALHEPVEMPEQPVQHAPVPPLADNFPLVRVEALGQGDQRRLFTVLTSRELDLAPGETGRLHVAMFAGPRKPELFNQAPYSWMGFSGMIRYELGCGWCTFQPLARGLLAFLKFIERLVHDWAVAIIILVLCVRALLHPITKRAQINMTKMGKQMQALQPEMEKLKTKYKDNPQKMQQETMKLYREKGVNPANLLGCLPMFLQMPLWIALYAMLAFAVELRHEPAFYGLFQAISPNWTFLADLSSPDRFITFYDEPRMFFFFDYSSLNVLPLLMGLVFYFNQRLMMPPPANEQAAQQQAIMKWMILLFPLILYSAPSGLTLYILASTCAGIVDSWIVRRHIKREEEAGTLFQKKERKPGGFMDRLAKAVEERQRQIQQAAERQQRERGGGGGGGGGGKRRKPK